MKSNADPWPWLSDFEAACAANDPERLRRALDSIRLDSRTTRNTHHERWSRLFIALVKLMTSDDGGVRESAYHQAMIVAEDEYGPPYDKHTCLDQHRNLAARTAAILPALASIVVQEPTFLLRCLGDLARAEACADLPRGALPRLGPQPQVAHRIASLPLSDASRFAALICYVHTRAPWESSRSLLFGALDHDDDRVRAVAARAIGARYLGFPGESTEKLEPSFQEIVETVTRKEIERPGIAGPLFSPWHQWQAGTFERRAGVKIDDWLCRILGARKANDPGVLVGESIDFLAHEVFGGRAEYIRKILGQGHEALALEAATEVSDRVDEVEPILMDLGNSESDDVCRLASWHLAYHYRRLHPEGAKRGFVRQIAFGTSAELFLNLRGHAHEAAYPHAAILYPREAVSFADAEARGYLDAVLPPLLRGHMVPYGMPGDGDMPGVYVFRDEARSRYSSGALVTFRFFGKPLRTRRRAMREDLSAQDWKQITIVWHGPSDTWRPEVSAHAPARA